MKHLKWPWQMSANAQSAMLLDVVSLLMIVFAFICLDLSTGGWTPFLAALALQYAMKLSARSAHYEDKEE